MTEFNDVAVFQPKTKAYFQKLKSLGSKGILVKLTQGSADGTAYVNVSAKEQLANAKAAGLPVGAYHYLTCNSARYGSDDPIAEAKWFMMYLKAYGINKTDPVIVDVEDGSLMSNATKDVKSFVKYVESQGYSNTWVYTMGSWFGSRISSSVTDRWWIASYGIAKLNISAAKAWQYTDNWHGLSVDGSHDYGSMFNYKEAAANTTSKPAKTSYYTWNPKLIQTLTKVGLYKDAEFKHRVRYYPAGTQFKIKEVVKTKAGTPRLLTDSGFYITANRDNVKNWYYVTNPKQIKVVKSTYLYKDKDRTKRIRKYGKGTVFTITDVISWGGVWILKTESGYYMTGNKDYVNIMN
ncbi:hypothetical protein [Lactobacillus curieae] [Lactiplantibacillus mudanjiangensis]|uniref:DUF5776 domain-containing protein n=1 Tax=Lactiplantibacillus mudanjiangensis TaxID=1296538 RepID=UPI0010157144|nr:hypothetical protein [Lactobacillus curieae] [Lactiplantibacillus mudanjiangensis]